MKNVTFTGKSFLNAASCLYTQKTQTPDTSLAEVRIANNSQTYQAFTICWALYFLNIF